ncbi:hypothetical protein JF546_05140 [Nitratireductor aquimarinus]|uniref:hypothetical protein n=1 Tax=Nitratireductor TaxID=245876 RepID=UPI0019D37AB5|nr:MULTISPECIES: hypothetical protein [Nitratireductor]MBN7775899.1 hypothetical protein [Nitratireductor pacificus]MBN7780562.1 hypothetical protein [Nitratireductor pacificus]MBN7789369.1 hypothetical protein [Nitratireductor aquimarinus]MBN8242388.1 hypothetical protein [Nitratireductor aquimarinus]MBY6098647.1 hypothetical protein [Nitratireductor aquimarinus]
MRRFLAVLLLIVFAFAGALPAMQTAFAADSVAATETAAHPADSSMMDCCGPASDGAMPFEMNCAMDCHYIAPFQVQQFHATVSPLASMPTVTLHQPVPLRLFRPPILA